MSAPEGGSEAREDACRDYQSSLEDLTFNSKPHINMLTILAEENVPFAKDIVSLIEAQIAKVFISLRPLLPERWGRTAPRGAAGGGRGA